MTTPHLTVSQLTLAAVQAEATRAHLKHGANSILSPTLANHDRLAVLVEEVGEGRPRHDVRRSRP